MPRHWELKKDATSCEKLRGGANNRWYADIRMGKPGREKPCHPQMNKIVCEEGTRGTETSKYLEEEKENSISQVAASERETAQTQCII